MNQKDALKKLRSKRKYIDSDVYDLIEKQVRRDIKEEIKKENDEFVEKALLLLNQGISVKVLKNMILSDLYNSKLIHKLQNPFYNI